MVASSTSAHPLIPCLPTTVRRERCSAVPWDCPILITRRVVSRIAKPLTKTFCTYNNDKPWFTPNLRRLRKVKEEAYRSGVRDLFRQTRNTLNREVRKARRCFGENLKRHLSANPDPSTVWKGLQSVTGYKKSPVESPRLANQLNKFYCRFDRSSHTMGLPAAQSTYSPLPTTALSTPLSSLSPTLCLAEAAPALQIHEEEVRQMFRRQKTRNAVIKYSGSTNLAAHLKKKHDIKVQC
ncbi:uncharacterized protein LOC133169594 [Syngnathus typhle]|uniref:uncharacterized protein LOC133169594 n=1 Tax=Syngnathus typhle TaxID=161592 RepID=UPI002A6B7B9D|nr:uncharacterized protein LOC133169594 [Syngnathus typhle]